MMPIPGMTAALLAARAILLHRDAAQHPQNKSDQTPVTQADLAAHHAAIQCLQTQFPQELVVSEEACEGIASPSGNWWLLDPLDGTKEFIAGSSEFAVSLARLHGNAVHSGILVAPLLGLMAWGSPAGAFTAKFDTAALLEFAEITASDWLNRSLHDIQALQVSQQFLQGKRPLKVLVSLRHGESFTDEHIQSLGSVQRMGIGACLKFIALAQGQADYYPRMVSLHEWDIAGGHAIVKAAGGNLYYAQTGCELTYGNSEFVSSPFIAY